jgi:poly(A) polymerase
MEIDEHHQHKDVYTHSLTVLDQAIALEKADPEAPSPDLVLRLAALLHDIGKPATRQRLPRGRVSFHHHEVVGARMARDRLRALRFSNEQVDDITQLVHLHLRFHGYGDDVWTDSAVRRYVRDAGPLLDKLNELTRCDCTTRNERKARRLAARMDALEARIAELQEREALEAIRPDLDGQAVMAHLGLPPGRLVGEALAMLLEARLEDGPLAEADAYARLDEWFRDRSPAASEGERA